MKAKILRIYFVIYVSTLIIYQCNALSLKAKLIKLLLLTSLTKKSFFVLPIPFPLPAAAFAGAKGGGLGGKKMPNMMMIQQQPWQEQWPSGFDMTEAWPTSSAGQMAAALQTLMASLPQQQQPWQDDWASSSASEAW